MNVDIWQNISPSNKNVSIPLVMLAMLYWYAANIICNSKKKIEAFSLVVYYSKVWGQYDLYF